MDNNKPDVDSLKQDFYLHHFADFNDFLNNLTLNPLSHQTPMNWMIARINKESGYQLYTIRQEERNGKIVKVYPHVQRESVQATLEDAVAAVEYFFNLLNENDQKNMDALEYVSKILDFLAEPGNGNIPEMKNLTEDHILRVICSHFKQKKYHDDSDIFDRNVEYHSVISGPIQDLLGNGGVGYFVQFLHTARIIRNKVTHKKSFISLYEGYHIYRFILFCYITTVALILKKNPELAKSQYPTIKLYVDNSEGWTLKQGNKVIVPIETESDKYYEISWFQYYTLEIDGKSLTFKCDHTYWSPLASKREDGTIDVSPNNHQASKATREAFFHKQIDTMDKILKETQGINKNIADIPKIYEKLADYCKRSEQWHGTQEQIAQKLDQILTVLIQTPEQAKVDKLYELLGIQTQILTTISDTQHDERESHQRIERKQAEILENQRTERERQEAKKSRMVKGCFGGLVGLLAITAGACLWHGLKDLSLQWLVHRWAYVAATVVILSLACCIGAYLTKKWKDEPVWKRWLPAGAVLLTCGFAAGSFLLTPALTYESFVKKYDFARHEPNENAAAAAYLKRQGNLKDEATLKLLATYYYKYTDSLSEAKKYAITLCDVRRYSEGCLVAAEVLLASRDPELNILINEYTNYFGHSNPVLDRIAGLQYLKGWGREKKETVAFDLMKKAADEGDVDAIYYMGHLTSHNYTTDWHEGESKHIIEPWLYLHFPLAVHYFQIASRLGHPRASLQLGKLYADVNMCDSAKYYYQQAIKQCDDHPGQLDSERIRQAAIFQTGLVYVSEGDTLNEYIGQARRMGYPPAFLYSALQEKDHVAAIDLYKQAGDYKGYRYIPPIVFEYIAVGDSVNALKALQSARPNGRFNMEFIRAMQLILGNKYVPKDTVQWIYPMRQAAEKGCQFAQLCCLTFEGIHNMHDFRIMEEVCKEIPYGNAINSYFDSRIFIQSVKSSAMALSYGHPAGAVAFFSACLKLDEEDKAEIENSEFYFRCLYSMSQVIIRMVSNRVYIDSSPSYKQSAIEIAVLAFLNYMSLDNKKLEDYEISFWGDVSIANHLFKIECILANECNSIFKLGLRQRLLSAALADASPDMNQDDLDLLSALISEPGFDLREQLGDKYKGDDFRYRLIYPDKELAGFYTLSHDVHTAVMYSFTVDGFVHEFSSLLEDYYEFALSEDDMIIPGITSRQ